jgi:hypothetical protein
VVVGEVPERVVLRAVRSLTNTTLSSTSALRARDSVGTHCIRGWVGRRAGLDGFRKISRLPGLFKHPVTCLRCSWLKSNLCGRTSVTPVRPAAVLTPAFLNVSPDAVKKLTTAALYDVTDGRRMDPYRSVVESDSTASSSDLHIFYSVSVLLFELRRLEIFFWKFNLDQTVGSYD